MKSICIFVLVFGSSATNNSSGFGFGAKPGGLFGATTSAPTFGSNVLIFSCYF